MPVRRITSNSDIVKRIARRAVDSNGRMHVLPRTGRWIVKKEGADRAVGVFASREEAIKAATSIKIKIAGISSIYIHDATGDVVNVIK